MNSMRFNGEGYFDPTAYVAIRMMLKSEWMETKKTRKQVDARILDSNRPPKTMREGRCKSK